MKLSTDQEAAMTKILDFFSSADEKEMVLKGHGGTGKSFLMDTALHRAQAHNQIMKMLRTPTNKLNLVLTATTNKAAKVLSDAVGREVRTIHSVLGLRVYNDYNTGKTVLHKSKATDVIENSIVIIDEASMINKELLKIIREQTSNCKVLYVGDPYQLAPVKENKSPVFDAVANQATLTTVHRQTAGNPIIQFSEYFRTALDTGKFTEVLPAGPEVQLLDPTAFQAEIDKSFTQLFMTPTTVRALAWTNRRVHELNEYIRHIQGKPAGFAVGDTILTNKPILAKNPNQKMYSTDSFATITGMQPGVMKGINGWDIKLGTNTQVFQAYQQKEVTALANQYKRAKEWAEFFYVQDNFADLRPIDACTITKSQGSTYDKVFIDLNDVAKCTSNSDIARMLYVAVTRARKSVIMTGSLPKRLYV